MLKFIVCVVLVAGGFYGGMLWSESNPPSNAALNAKAKATQVAKTTIGKSVDVARAAGSAGLQAATK